MNASERSSTTPRRGSPLLLVPVLMAVLFFQGCESKGVALTAGPVVPFLSFIYENDSLFYSQLKYLSLGRACLNVAVLMLAFGVAPRYSKCWNTVARSRRFQATAILIAILYNLILFAEGLWMHLVFWPIELICDFIDARVGIATTGDALTIAIVSRGYFLACWALCYGLVCLSLSISERYLGFDRSRWWQFNIRLLMAVTFLVGTLLGIALRFLPVDS